MNNRYDKRVLGRDFYVTNDTRVTHLNNNDLIIGGSGSGKTGGVIYPTLKCAENESYVFVDAKGLMSKMFDTPAHYNTPHEPNSGVKQFDYITSNPPFKMNFSSTRNGIEQKWSECDKVDGLKRFFAGIPKIPPTDKAKKKMPIYLCFIQHILWSLKENGKAAIVVPTGFITAKNGIEKTIRTTLVDRKWIKGVVSFPSDIFANTGTNVSVLFIDKSNTSDDIMLVDASKLGTVIKEGDNQKTVLSDEECELIKTTFINQQIQDDFSVIVTNEQVKKKEYSLSAGQYFDVKIELVEISEDEFYSKVNKYKNTIDKLFEEGDELKKQISNKLEGLKYE